MIADLAVVKAGAVKVPLNDMLTTDEIEYLVSDAGVETVICGPEFAETVDDFRSSVDSLETCIAIEGDQAILVAVQKPAMHIEGGGID